MQHECQYESEASTSLKISPKITKLKFISLLNTTLYLGKSVNMLNCPLDQMTWTSMVSAYWLNHSYNDKFQKISFKEYALSDKRK